MYDSENRFKMSIPEYLKNNNIKVKIYYGTKNIFHHKIVLIDSKLLIISSFNWYHNDILHNYDFYLVIDDKKVCSTIKLWFAKLDQSNNFKYLILKSKSLKKITKSLKNLFYCFYYQVF
jgi:phosphatidylserine/phosphatidylglycerophosphate/cardiolipin synthase-like enzyme